MPGPLAGFPASLCKRGHLIGLYALEQLATRVGRAWGRSSVCGGGPEAVTAYIGWARKQSAGIRGWALDLSLTSNKLRLPTSV